jgi:integrase
MSEAEILFRELIHRLKLGSQRFAHLLQINQKIFDHFWRDVYSHKILEDENSPRYGILKALRIIEPLSIQVATQAELQDKLKRSSLGLSEIRRATDNLNQVLNYLDRGFRLNKPKAGLRQVDFVTREEFEKMLAFLEGDAKDLAETLFSTGMRLGEALAVEPNDFKNGAVSITKQLTRRGVLKLPKAEKTGTSIVLMFGHEAISRWSCVKDKLRFRETIYDVITKASFKALGRSISPHDLRHSHAIYLLGHGANLTQVALQLRNRVDVCQMYYTGFSHSEASLELLKKLVDAKR